MAAPSPPNTAAAAHATPCGVMHGAEDGAHGDGCAPYGRRGGATAPRPVAPPPRSTPCRARRTTAPPGRPRRAAAWRGLAGRPSGRTAAQTADPRDLTPAESRLPARVPSALFRFDAHRRRRRGAREHARARTARGFPCADATLHSASFRSPPGWRAGSRSNGRGRPTSPPPGRTGRRFSTGSHRWTRIFAATGRANRRWEMDLVPGLRGRGAFGRPPPRCAFRRRRSPPSGVRTAVAARRAGGAADRDRRLRRLRRTPDEPYPYPGRGLDRPPVGSRPSEIARRAATCCSRCMRPEISPVASSEIAACGAARADAAEITRTRLKLKNYGRHRLADRRNGGRRRAGAIPARSCSARDGAW